MKKKTKHTLLKGEGTNQHTLYGSFSIDDKSELAVLSVDKESILRHEQPDGSFGEHFALKIEKGNWVMGKQVEYNPFDRKITRIWD